MLHVYSLCEISRSYKMFRFIEDIIKHKNIVQKNEIPPKRLKVNSKGIFRYTHHEGLKSQNNFHC